MVSSKGYIGTDSFVPSSAQAQSVWGAAANGGVRKKKKKKKKNG